MLYLLEAYSNLVQQGRMAECSLNWGQGGGLQARGSGDFCKIIILCIFLLEIISPPPALLSLTRPIF